MKLTRRQFSLGALALAAKAVIPGGLVPAPAGAGFDDAYTRILIEFFRTEEAAMLSSPSYAASGALSWKGRALESFLSALDARVDPIQTASQLFGELRNRLTEKARLVSEHDDAGAPRLAREIRCYAEEWLSEEQSDPAESESGTNA